MVQQTGIQNVLGALVHFGVFRRLVVEGRTRTEVESLKTQIILDPALRARCDARILLNFIAGYSTALPELGEAKPAALALDPGVAPESEEEVDEQPAASNKTWNRRPKPLLERERAESQVDRIATLFGQGNDGTAYQYLDELVKSQTGDNSDHSHVVKSLCNIASQCTVRGRQDVSLECLHRALKYDRGIDAILYLQIGNEFRNLGQYDRAISCFEMAAQLDHGEKRDSIRLEIIRTSVARGEYGKA